MRSFYVIFALLFGLTNCGSDKKESVILGEDTELATTTKDGHPYKLKYKIDMNHDANNCEFYVNSFADARFSRNIVDNAWFSVDYVVNKSIGEILNTGIYAETIDAEANAPKTQKTLYFGSRNDDTDNPEIYNNQIKYRTSSTSGTGERTVSAFKVEKVAFFIDVKDPSGKINRLWIKNGKDNFTVDEIFKGHKGPDGSTGSGPIYTAGDTSPVFNQKKACKK